MLDSLRKVQGLEQTLCFSKMLFVRDPTYEGLQHELISIFLLIEALIGLMFIEMYEVKCNVFTLNKLLIID